MQSHQLALLNLYTFLSFDELHSPPLLWASQVALAVKNPPANAGDIGDHRLGRSAGEGLPTHSSILAWRLPCTEEPSGLQSMGLQRVRQDWSKLSTRAHLFSYHNLCLSPVLFPLWLIKKNAQWISESESRAVVSDSLDPVDYTVHGILQARILEWVAIPFARQEIFPTQGWNPDLPHCRRILYQLSCEESLDVRVGP